MNRTSDGGLEHYATILESMTPADVVVVATKCDILIDNGEVAPPQAFETYDGSVEEITEYLTTRPDVEQLLQTAGESRITPVYFETKKHDGEYVPQLDDTGNIVPVGYDHLIEELRSRQ